MQHITIRDTTLDDVVPLRAMHGQSWRDTYPNDEYGVSRRWVEERTAAWLTPEGIEGSLEHSKNIYGKPFHLHRIAIDDGEIVGIVHASKFDGKQHLEALYVDKAYYGTGLAKRLMEQALAWCDVSWPIDLQVATYNERAKAFYRKYGFKEVAGTEELFADMIPVITMEREASI
jgi:ribosomal protein S18 acetylase RimI-like enzyme